MRSAAGTLTVLLLLLDVGAAQVLATGKPARAETDIKYAVIGTAVGVAISAGFLALKFCMIRKHVFDDDSSDLRNANLGVGETIALKKRTSSPPSGSPSPVIVSPAAAMPQLGNYMYSASSFPAATQPHCSSV